MAVISVLFIVPAVETTSKNDRKFNFTKQKKHLKYIMCAY